MRKKYLISISILLLCAITWALNTTHRQSQSLDGTTGLVVYASNDIAKGTAITKDSIVESEIPICKMSDHLAISSAEVLGHKARYGITKGEIISLYGLDPYPTDLPVRAVKCVKRIERGAIIIADSLSLCQRVAGELTKTRFESISRVVGRKARSNIDAGSIILDEQVEPRPQEKHL